MDHGHRSVNPHDAAIAHGSTHSLSDDAARDELWMVQAVIQPFKLDPVTRALEAISGFSGMTVMRVRGFGREKLEDRHTASHATPSGKAHHEALDDFTEKLRLDVAVCGVQRADAVAATIARVAHTGNRGDGKIFIWPLS
ncbi:MAG: P-II family nitrogen regulator, partial [Gemmatimonadaceae bacterium]